MDAIPLKLGLQDTPTGPLATELSSTSEPYFDLRDIQVGSFDLCQVLGLNYIPLVRSPGF